MLLISIATHTGTQEDLLMLNSAKVEFTVFKNRPLVEFMLRGGYHQSNR